MAGRRGASVRSTSRNSIRPTGHHYYNHLGNPLVTLPDLLPDGQNVYHLFPILVKDNKRDKLHDYLQQHGVGTICHYPTPPHLQDCYRKEPWNQPTLQLPITERLADEELSLPIGPSITNEEVEIVIELINKFE